MGARGIGKTTLILQHIKEQPSQKESLYVQAEDFYFVRHRLTELADDFAKIGGKYLFIDEIHKYKDWARELKLIYDYHPELQNLTQLCPLPTISINDTATKTRQEGQSWVK